MNRGTQRRLLSRLQAEWHQAATFLWLPLVRVIYEARYLQEHKYSPIKKSETVNGELIHELHYTIYNNIPMQALLLCNYTCNYISCIIYCHEAELLLKGMSK